MFFMEAEEETTDGETEKLQLVLEYSHSSGLFFVDLSTWVMPVVKILSGIQLTSWIT